MPFLQKKKTQTSSFISVKLQTPHHCGTIVLCKRRLCLVDCISVLYSAAQTSSLSKTLDSCAASRAGEAEFRHQGLVCDKQCQEESEVSQEITL